ncbi:hypothetical protein CBR_g22943 [Chara braunii]|uniref:FAD-binding domain-containing protein n=1 Tax=Chara braunii TaxID=69332 RepID=A0A388L342_CHABU|nr:hypothetical protein CBR_g22943 [Chara braunii]|eukprot:GBG76725.1 hypothetical protein CBR_g22943 [Chara braunii]
MSSVSTIMMSVSTHQQLLIHDSSVFFLHEGIFRHGIARSRSLSRRVPGKNQSWDSIRNRDSHCQSVLACSPGSGHGKMSLRSRSSPLRSAQRWCFCSTAVRLHERTGICALPRPAAVNHNTRNVVMLDQVVVPHHRSSGTTMIIGDQLGAAACSLSRPDHLADVSAAGRVPDGHRRHRQKTIRPGSFVSRSRPRPFSRGPADRPSITSAAAAGASAAAADGIGGDRSGPADDDDDVNSLKSTRGRSALTPGPSADAAAAPAAAAADVVIVGGGIAGLATALALHKVGISAKVLEKAPGLRGEGASIGIWSNAWRALEVLGVADELRPHSFQIDKVMTWTLSQSTRRLISSMDLRGGGGNKAPPSSSSSFLELRGVMRNRLLGALSRSLPPDTIQFNAGVSSIRQVIPSAAAAAAAAAVAADHWDPDSATNRDRDLRQTPTLEVRSEDGATWTPKVLIGCDGIGSKVASWLGLPKPVYSGQMAYRGVAEFPSGIPTWAGRTPSAEDPCWCFQQTVGIGMRVGMYPINDKLVYWFVTYNNRDQNDAPPAEPSARKAALLALLSGWEESGIVDTVENTKAEFVTHSVLSGRYYPPPLPGVRWGRGCVTLAGDSAHPMTPNLGQGGCMALEDAVVLARQLAASGAFPSTTTSRLKTTTGTATGRSTQSRTEEFNLIASAIERYERERIVRTTLITYRSWAVGELMQSTFAPLRFFRDEILLPYVVSPKTLKRTTEYDCGTLIRPSQDSRRA